MKLSELSSKEIKTPTGDKCPECDEEGNYTCPICEGNLYSTIEIEKECICGHLISRHNYDFSGECSDCSGGQCEEFKPKYKVGDEIRINCPLLVADTKDVLEHKGLLENCPYNCYGGTLKLKIMPENLSGFPHQKVSETETHQKLQMVR